MCRLYRTKTVLCRIGMVLRRMRMLQIIPKPNGPVKIGQGEYKIPESIIADTGSFASWCLEAFSCRTQKQIREGTPWLILSKQALSNPQGYTLEVDKNGIAVTAANESGVVHALTTLYLMMDGCGAVPLCRIQDSPKYGHRGLSIDCSRHFFPVDVIKKVIEQMALVKLNVLHWHLTDDQGWRIESNRFPKLHAVSNAYYTQQQIHSVVEYARNRGVEIIPEIDLPGHATAMLVAYPELSCTGQTMTFEQNHGVFHNALCPGKETVFHFLEELLAEICPLFPSEYIHVGGDEVHKDAWEVCPHCAKRMEEQRITRGEDLQGYFTNRIAAILAQQGKRIICWNDSLEADNLTENALIQYWTNKHAQSMQDYMKTGKRFLYSWKFNLYFDYPYEMTPVSKVYGFTPVIEEGVAIEPDLLVGFEGCLWAEGIADLEKLGKMVFPRAYALAENAWTREKDYEDFKLRLRKILEISNRNGVPYNKQENWDRIAK